MLLDLSILSRQQLCVILTTVGKRQEEKVCPTIDSKIIIVLLLRP